MPTVITFWDNVRVDFHIILGKISADFHNIPV